MLIRAWEPATAPADEIRACRDIYNEGTDGVGFAEALGLRCALRDPRSLLDLSALDHRRIDALATAAHPGYAMRCWRDELPEDMLAPYALAKRTMNEAPTGELDAAPMNYDAERIRDKVAIQRHRGNRVYRLVAVHEPTGVVAGLTELAVLRICPTRGDQGDTCVVPAHLGRGLGLWMKAAMLRLLRTTEPGLVDVQTWNAETNAHMLAVNAALGFHRDRMWREYQASVAGLGGTLSVTTQPAAIW